MKLARPFWRSFAAAVWTISKEIWNNEHQWTCRITSQTRNRILWCCLKWRKQIAEKKPFEDFSFFPRLLNDFLRTGASPPETQSLPAPPSVRGQYLATMAQHGTINLLTIAAVLRSWVVHFGQFLRSVHLFKGWMDADLEQPQSLSEAFATSSNLMTLLRCRVAVLNKKIESGAVPEGFREDRSCVDFWGVLNSSKLHIKIIPTRTFRGFDNVLLIFVRVFGERNSSFFRTVTTH